MLFYVVFFACGAEAIITKMLFCLGKPCLLIPWGIGIASDDRPVVRVDGFLAPAVTVGETKGAMDSTSVFFGLFFCL